MQGLFHEEAAKKCKKIDSVEILLQSRFIRNVQQPKQTNNNFFACQPNKFSKSFSNKSGDIK